MANTIEFSGASPITKDTYILGLNTQPPYSAKSKPSDLAHLIGDNVFASKEDTYTKTEVDAKIAEGGGGASVHVGDEPPTDKSNLWVDTDDDGDISLLVVPVGTILPFLGSTEPTGFYFCEGQYLDPVVYSKLFSIIGYTYGRQGDLFRLPDLRGRFLEGSDIVGTYKEAGLPNIYGELNASGDVDYTTAKSYSGTGVITARNGVHPYASKGSGTDSNWDGFTLDASKGGTDPVYGKSSTVQPASLTVRYIIKAYDSVTTDTEVVEIESQIGSLVSRTTTLEGNAVVAFGGNDSTGYYMRWENGTQICWKRLYVGSVSFSAWGNLYTSPSIDMGAMPMPFIAPPVAVYSANHATADWTIIIGTVTPTISTAWSNLAVIRPSSTNTLSLYFNAYAIGRWK